VRNWLRFWRLPLIEKRLLVESLFMLPLTGLALRSVGFNRWRGALARLAPGREPRTSDSAEILTARADAITRIVKAAACHGPYRGNCLEQSVALWWLLRRGGIESDLRFGARKEASRIEAHAWVEFKGRPLNDNLDVHLRFKPFGRDVMPADGDF
jgi:hypothetical protein